MHLCFETKGSHNFEKLNLKGSLGHRRQYFMEDSDHKYMNNKTKKFNTAGTNRIVQQPDYDHHERQHFPILFQSSSIQWNDDLCSLRLLGEYIILFIT